MSSPSPLFDQAFAAAARGERALARELYQQILRDDPLNPAALANHAALLTDLGGKESIELAILSYLTALELDPTLWQIWNNLGNAYRELAQLDDAIGALGKATQIAPSQPDPWMNLATALKDVGLLDESITAFQRSINLRPTFAPAHSNFLFALLFHPKATPQTHLAAAREWEARHAAPLYATWKPHELDLSPHRPLRLGYVGADFRSHAQTHFTLPLLANHDPTEFHLHIYASVLPEDDITEQHKKIVAAKGGVWIDALNLTDEQLAGKIRADKIDILIDLTMHMSGSRLLTFARKPAPIQITYLAYPGTTGLRAINYRLTDPHLDPSSHDNLYAETSLRLPETFWCYDPLSRLPVSPLPALTNHHITFGCLNNYCKVTDSSLALFSSVLTALPTARLLLLSPEGAHRQRLLTRLPPDVASRIDFVTSRPRAEYLQLFHQIDISLDTTPVNGHTTSLDSLWMGVPVVTLVTANALGRAGLSQLTNLNLPHLITHTPTDYTAQATALAADLPALARLRQTLRNRMETSPLMDATKFTKSLENTLKTIWRQLCQA